MSFFAELRRRNVIRMAGLYLVGAWLIVQVVGTLSPMLGAPPWVGRTVLALLAIGFMPALVVAWVFELTPSGLKRDDQVAPAESIAPQTARRMDRMIFVVMALALGYFAFDKFVLAPARTTPAPAATASAIADSQTGTDKSIAVLPFADFSASGDQGWFADGLAEEILNSLARTPDLLVSARTSSFRYKGSELAIPQIAKELGVAHVLEGSVRSTPQRIRVTAQLIRAADGFQLWSQTYDRDVADMIEIQEDLARQIAMAMQTSMDPQALSAMAEVGTRSVEAYQAFVRGLVKQSTGTEVGFKEAYDYFEQARTLDPTFAAAHARAAAFWQTQLYIENRRSGLTEATPERMGREFDERIDLAIAQARNEINRISYRAAKASRELRLREAMELTRAYLDQRPGDATSYGLLLRLASQLGERQLLAATLDALWPRALTSVELADLHMSTAYRGLDPGKAADLALQLAQRWPDSADVLYQVHRALLWDGRVGDAAAVLARWQSLTDDSDRTNAIPPARQACAEGRRADAEAILARLPEDNITARWHVLMLLGRTREADALLQSLERAGFTAAPASVLIYPQFDPAPFPSLLQLLEREKAQRPPPTPEPFACPPAAAAP
jgi:TolB-like protein